MAAKTPSTVVQHNAGSQTKIVATFTDLDDGDTWASGIVGVQDWICQDTDNPTTQASVGIAVSYSGTTFTFYPAEDNKTAKLIIYK